MNQGREVEAGFPRIGLWLVISFFAALSAAIGYLASYGGSLVSGLAVDLGLLMYVMALLTYAKARYVPLGLMLGADSGHLVYEAEVLHARVALYPLVEVLTSITGHVSYDVDLVQLIVLVEVLYALYVVASRRFSKQSGAVKTSQGQVPPQA